MSLDFEPHRTSASSWATSAAWASCATGAIRAEPAEQPSWEAEQPDGHLDHQDRSARSRDYRSVRRAGDWPCATCAD